MALHDRCIVPVPHDWLIAWISRSTGGPIKVVSWSMSSSKLLPVFFNKKQEAVFKQWNKKKSARKPWCLFRTMFHHMYLKALCCLERKCFSHNWLLTWHTASPDLNLIEDMSVLLKHEIMLFFFFLDGRLIKVMYKGWLYKNCIFWKAKNLTHFLIIVQITFSPRNVAKRKLVVARNCTHSIVSV